jgi:uncharacterized protein (TIGR02284 family)
MSEYSNSLKSLHTILIDSRNGYQEALKDAEGRGLTPLFNDMIALREKDSTEIGVLLASAGETAQPDGSFMTAVNRTIISIRSMFGELDERILPGLIDGEKRILSYYDDALKAGGDTSSVATLVSQRQNLAQIVGRMEAQSAAAA